MMAATFVRELFPPDVLPNQTLKGVISLTLLGSNLNRDRCSLLRMPLISESVITKTTRLFATDKWCLTIEDITLYKTESLCLLVCLNVLLLVVVWLFVIWHCDSFYTRQLFRQCMKHAISRTFVSGNFIAFSSCNRLQQWHLGVKLVFDGLACIIFQSVADWIWNKQIK